MARAAQWARDLSGAFVVLLLLAGVYVLPPDTSLSELRRAGRISVCVPPAYPPLVTGDPNRPGIDIELLRALAKAMGLDLVLNVNPAMGRDFNPRNWGVTRAHCQILAGGVVDGTVTRSFLDTSPAYGRTGWALFGPGAIDDPRGRSVGVYAGLASLDPVALSAHLRQARARIGIAASPAELVEGLKAGRFEVAITEALLARQLAAANGWRSVPLAGSLGDQKLVLGLWKGDLTLKREIASRLDRFERDGVTAEILGRYLGAKQ